MQLVLFFFVVVGSRLGQHGSVKSGGEIGEGFKCRNVLFELFEYISTVIVKS